MEIMADALFRARASLLKRRGSLVNSSTRFLMNLHHEEWVESAIEALKKLDEQGLELHRNNAICLLQEAISRKELSVGMELHRLTSKHLLESDTFLGTLYIRFFSLFGYLAKAAQIFSKLHNPSVYTWSAIISAHAKLGKGEDGVKLFHQMLKSTLKPDEHILVAVVHACTSIPSLNKGKKVHKYIEENCFGSNVHVVSALVDMYSKCGDIEDACSVFNMLQKRDLVIWNAMISAYAHHNCNEEALQLFCQLQYEPMKANDMTFVSVVKACASVGSADPGMLIHEQITKDCYRSNVLLENTLIDMYAKCGCLDEACKVFDKMQNRDGTTWNVIITGYTQHGHGQKALQLISQMQQESMKLSGAFVPLLNACSSISALDEGKCIHARVMGSSLLDINVGNALIDMYSKCVDLEEAYRVFNKWPNKNVVTWNSMISGYVQQGHGEMPFFFFKQMLMEGVKPTDATFLCMLKACSRCTNVKLGKQMHRCIIEGGLELDILIANTLIDMYAKCGSVDDAHEIFYNVPRKTVVTWNAMIACYNMNNHGQEALELLLEMKRNGLEPNDVTFVNGAKASSSMEALIPCMQIHALILQSDHTSNAIIGNALIDMYAECGSLDDAYGVFSKSEKQKVSTWNAIISAYAQHGEYVVALQYLEDMQQEGLKPNDLTFVCLLSACSHMGLVDEGFDLFKSMIVDHGITPKLDHYSCMIDLFGRIGKCQEAQDFLETMPFNPNTIVWTSLLNHCRTHGNADVGKRCFDNFVAEDARDASPYMLMSSIYADACEWDKVNKIQELRKHVDAWKRPGQALVNVDKKLHCFMVGEKSHPCIDEIHAILDKISARMKVGGFLPNVDSVLQPILDLDKDNIICG